MNMFGNRAACAAALAILTLFPLSSGAEAACLDERSACKVESGRYHISWPPGVPRTTKVPAVVALHSWGGTGAGLLQSGKMVKTLLAEGYAVIAPEGLARSEGAGNSWEVQIASARRNDPAFIKSVADDAAQRFNIDRSRMLLVGFSVGGSMVAYTACRYPSAFKGFAPVSGSFWQPQPAECSGPVNYLHSHGKSDNTMPLQGRAVGKGLRQGNVLKALDTFAKASGCSGTTTADSGGVTSKKWTGCAGGRSVRFDMHPGGHSVPRGWAKRAVSWFESL
jgi:polyhydroxybutyrate depolymerase